MIIHILANKKTEEKLNLKEDIFKFHYENHKNHVYDLIIASNTEEIIKLDEYTPILYLTEEYSKEEALEVFNKGVDDYQPISIDMDILLIKIKLLIRYDKKLYVPPPKKIIENKDYKVGKYTFNSLKRDLYYDGEYVGTLRNKECELFSLLASNINRVVSIIHICRHLWGEEYKYKKETLFTLRMHIFSIKKLLKKTPTVFINNIYEEGYKLIVRKN